MTNGIQATTIQGAEYDGTLYEPGSSVTYTPIGDSFTGVAASATETKTYKLRGDATTKTLYTTSSVTITKQGSKCPYDLYYKSSSGAYISMGATMYYGGSDVTYYTRSKYADAGDLYESGGSATVTVITEEYDGLLYKPGTPTTIKKQGDRCEAALYRDGTKYSGGLYTNFKPASIETQNVTALTV